MTLKEQFEFDLTNGEEIDNMTRSNGYYLRYNHDESRTVLFYNGNQYTLNPEGEATERVDANNELFIDRQIIKAVTNYLISKPIMAEKYEYSNSNYDECIEIYRISKDDKKERNLIVRIVMNRDSKRVDIPNIMIPFELKHNGIGKGILLEIFKIIQKHNYKLHLVQLVESFYDRMVKRGAKIIAPLDVVEITKSTNLN